MNNSGINNRVARTILILDNNEARIARFQAVVATLGADFELKVWKDAPSMIAECESYFSSAALICLDHDLKQSNGTLDAGAIRSIATFLADFLPVCPVLIHASNMNGMDSIQNEFRFAKWMVDRVSSIGTDWIEQTWAQRARDLISEHANTWKANLPADHTSRVERMKLSLDGLGLGDALGEMLSYQSANAPKFLLNNDLPAGPWFHTDDTEMAISIVAVLKSHGEVNQGALAQRFARRFERDPERGYGSMTRIQMGELIAGGKWRATAANAFHGQGSMGNGGAMRVAPLGAYFADDLERCVAEARASSVVTHTHPEGVAGTIAVAVAAAMAWQLKATSANEYSRQFIDEVIRFTPESRVHQGIQQASRLPADFLVEDAARVLGNGSLVTAPDTVPFCVWLAAHYPANFKEALTQTIRVDGDCDTNAAIVGGIVALSAGREAIPTDWLRAREPIHI